MPTMPPPAILIVDDDKSVRRFMRRTLIDAGYVTVEAHSADQAGVVMHGYPGGLQLVILDLVMPGGGGLDFANQLESERPGTKVLYVSGYGESVAAASITGLEPKAVL